MDALVNVGQVFFLRRMTFGINPIAYAACLELFSDSFKYAFKAMPAMALIAKLIPVTIESAMFAFFTGLGTVT